MNDQPIADILCRAAIVVEKKCYFNCLFITNVMYSNED